MKTHKQERLADIGTAWLSDFAYHGRIPGLHGQQVLDPSLCNQIANFMDKFGIGGSEYGRIMDAAGKSKAFLHRLYAHHLIYDFPFANPEHSIDFLVHEFSDLFTKNGLPIIPGELLEDASTWLKGITRNPNPCKNWNFLNGFDLLAGTISVYAGSRELITAINQEMSVESFGDVARTIGIGAIELAIALSHANPLLLIGSLLKLTAGVRGIFNDGDIIYMRRQQHKLSLEFSLKNSTIESAMAALSVKGSLCSTSIENALEDARRMSFE